MFNNLFGGGDGAPGMGDLMKVLAPLMMPGGNPQEKTENIVRKFVTPENIAKYSGKIIEGVAALQQAKGQKYVVHIETTSDNKDLHIGILNRSENGVLAPLQSIYLSRITQQDIIFLISLIFSQNGTASTNGTATA